MYCTTCGKTMPEGTRFCVDCGTSIGNPGRAQSAAVPKADVSPKSRLVVTLLAYFVGVLGVHRFYLGKIGTGIAMIFTFGGLGIWAFVDFIIAVCGMMKDKEGKVISDWKVKG
jgi:TM2 domain-containing membrane protein YozV